MQKGKKVLNEQKCCRVKRFLPYKNELQLPKHIDITGFDNNLLVLNKYFTFNTHEGNTPQNFLYLFVLVNEEPTTQNLSYEIYLTKCIDLLRY